MPHPIKLGFFCDSSSLRDSRYMVVGGLAIRLARYREFDETIQGIKDAGGIASELKWSAYKGGGRANAYKGTVDLFFSMLAERQAHFHCLIAEFGEFSHKAFSGGSPEASVNRMYSQLLIHKICRNYAGKTDIYVYPDYGNDSADLMKYHGWINLQASQRYDVPHSIRVIEPTDSGKSNLLQMADVIIGGIAYSCNAREQVLGEETPKATLARYILGQSGLRSWLDGTPPNTRSLSVWRFRHQKWVMPPRGARRYIRRG